MSMKVRVCSIEVYPCGSNPDGTVFWCQREVCHDVDVPDPSPGTIKALRSGLMKTLKASGAHVSDQFLAELDMWSSRR